MLNETDKPKDLLRSIWASQAEEIPQLDEDCTPNKTCKNMKDVTFDGFAEDGVDLATAWKQKLAREGKLSSGTGSIRDLVLGTNNSN